MSYKYELTILVESEDKEKLQDLVDNVGELQSSLMLLPGVLSVVVTSRIVDDEDGPQHEHLKGNEDEP